VAGSLTFVADGNTTQGLFDADGNIRVTLNDTSNTYGVWAKNGTFRVTYESTNTTDALHAADGSFNFWVNGSGYVYFKSGLLEAWNYTPYLYTLSGASTLLVGETSGWAVDFTDNSARVIDTVTPANNYSSYANRGLFTYAAPSNKTVHKSGSVKFENHNLCIQSQTFDNASWVKSNVTVTADAVAAPDGTMTADQMVAIAGTTPKVLDCANITTLVVPYRWSIYVKAAVGWTWVQLRVGAGLSGTAFANFDIVNGTVGTVTTFTNATITSFGNGWWKIGVNITPSAATGPFVIQGASGTAMARGASTTDAGGEGVYVWGAEVKRFPVHDDNTLSAYVTTTTAAVYYAPIETTAAGTVLGYLAEDARTNLVTYSEDLSQASWIKSNCTVNSNATTGPDGQVLADEEVTTSTAGVTYVQPTLADSSTYTFSVYVKRSTGSSDWARIGCVDKSGAAHRGWFNVQTGAKGSTTGTVLYSKMVDLGSGWYRCSISFPSATGAGTPTAGVSPATADTVNTCVSGDKIYIWGAQVELGEFETSLIRTYSATVTRAADSLRLPTSQYEKSDTTRTMIVKAIDPKGSYTSTFRVLAASDNNGSADRHQLRKTSAAATTSAFLSTASVTQVNDAPAGSITVDTAFKVGNTVQANDSATALNGGAVTADASVTMNATSFSRIGVDHSGNNFNGYIQQVTYLPRRITNVELQTKTT